MANYELYPLTRKGTQLWEGGVAPDAVPGVTSPNYSATTPNTAGHRLAALENARSQGVITEAEYAEKRHRLEVDAEGERKLAALEEMRRAGILYPMEYESKKRDIMFETQGPAPVTPVASV